MNRRDVRRVFRLVAMLGLPPALSAAQTGWTAQLVLPPLPSPYLSDWEMDPGAASIVVTNGTSTTTDITFHYSLTRGGQLLLRGVTDAHTIAASATETFDATSSFGGRADWDRDVQDLVARTGRLPEGEFEGCVTIVDPGGLVLVPQQCVRFSTLYPDPPALVFPLNGDTVTTQDPIFEWLPVQLPQIGDGRVGYVLQIAEVNTTARQLPEVALSANLPHYLEPGLAETAHPYPVGAQPLVPGRTYAWRVQALDGDGRPVAANQGRSEVWTFVYREPASEVQAVVASIVLTPRRDTLRYAGDTARYEAIAYDADNLEIRGKKISWRSLDTTIVRVDTLGVVRGVRAGETRVVASVDGIADSAFSVTRIPTGLTVRFERWDTQAAKPALLELIESGSFDEIVPKLQELLQSGELRIPIPRIAALEGAASGGGQNDEEPEDGHGPSPSLRAAFPSVQDPCTDASGIAEAHLDDGRKVWAVQIAASLVDRCVFPGSENQPSMVVAPDTMLHASVLFAVSWQHPGVPRAFLVIKGIAQLPFPLPLVGTTSGTSYIVVNISRSVTLESGLLPADFPEFFGSQSFDVGTGITFYHKMRCVDASAWLCQVLTGINEDNPEITLQVFAGVTASETSVNLSGVGHSLALGLSIKATLPVRKWNPDVEGLSLDSTQLGLMFAVQDSMVEAPGVPAHNWSIGVAPVLTIWFSGSRGVNWQVDASIGLEWDPTKAAEAQKPKLVVSAQLSNMLQLWPVRLGNLQFVFTTPIGSRREREATTLQISGTWGFGENQGLVIADAGGDVRGDVGAGSSGGTEGFEEIGRGQVTFRWERPRTEATRQAQLKTRDDLTKELLRQIHAQRDAKNKLEAADELVQEERRLRIPGTPPTAHLAALEKAFLEAQSEYATASVLVVQLQADREEARNALGPAKCWKRWRLRGEIRCVNWSGSFSIGNGSIVDIIAALMRSGASQ